MHKTSSDANNINLLATNETSRVVLQQNTLCITSHLNRYVNYFKSSVTIPNGDYSTVDVGICWDRKSVISIW